MSSQRVREYLGRWGAGILILCAPLGCGDDDSPRNAQICTEEFAGPECEVFELVNNERAQAGRPALRFDVNLARAARDHARDMVERSYFSHSSPEGGTFSERARANGYEGFPRGENIAYGQFSAPDVMQSWMDSKGHRDNILDDTATSIGVGLDGTHWVQVFGVD